MPKKYYTLVSKDIKIITSGDRQAEIEAAVSELNRK